MAAAQLAVREAARVLGGSIGIGTQAMRAASTAASCSYTSRLWRSEMVAETSGFVGMRAARVSHVGRVGKGISALGGRGSLLARAFGADAAGDDRGGSTKGYDDNEEIDIMTEGEDESEPDDEVTELRNRVLAAAEEMATHKIPSKHVPNARRISTLRALQIEQLAELLAMSGLSTEGTKNELIERLQPFLMAGLEPPPKKKSIELSYSYFTKRLHSKRRPIVAAEEKEAVNREEMLSLADLDHLESKEIASVAAVKFGYKRCLTLRQIMELLLQVAGKDVCLIDVRGKCQWTEYMVLVTCTSVNHLKTVSMSVLYLLKDHEEDYGGEVAPGKKPVIEGTDDTEWKLIDCGNIMVHCFMEEARTKYNLEELWGKGTLVETPETFLGGLREDKDSW